MQTGTSVPSQPEAILSWLHNEMSYRPLGPYTASSYASTPSPDAIRRVCRGNMIPVFEFLLSRVKSEKTVDTIRRNIVVHGDYNGTEPVKSNDRRGVGRKKERPKRHAGSFEEGNSNGNNRETALLEREAAEKEVRRMRCGIRRLRKELNAKMIEVSREEAERKRMLDERSNSRHKQVMLEAYGARCDVVARIFTQYHKYLSSYVNRVRDSQRADADANANALDGDTNSFRLNNEVSNETNRERNIRNACELLAEKSIGKIRDAFPAYEGNGIHGNPQLEASKLGIDFHGDIPVEVRDVILDCLKSPPQLLLALTAYTHRLKYVVAKEIEKIDIRADAERLRYRYENHGVIDASPDSDSQLPLQLYGNGNIGLDMPSKGSRFQRIERQKVHVQKFMATEDQLNKAAEARSVCQKLLKRLYGEVGAPFSSQSMSSLRQLELDVWTMEREAAGLKASLTILTNEAQRLNRLCLERKEVEDLINKKWKKIEEFDARRLELKLVCDALIKANSDVAALWNQIPLAAREQASVTIIPACTCVASMANETKDLIDKEVSTCSCIPDNRLYMLPSTTQALLESVGPTGYTRPEAIAAAAAEKNAELMTARAVLGDPSAIPSICRVSAALQYTSGSVASLASVLESMGFCLNLRGSEASVLEELSKALNMVFTNRDLVESGRSLLDHAKHSQKEYKTMTSYCLDLASEQEEIFTNQWLPELRKIIADAGKSLDDCKYIEGLLDEWWEQPASTLVDWVTVDEQNVVAWQNHVKQLLAAYDNLVVS